MEPRPAHTSPSPIDDPALSLKAVGAWVLLTKMAGPDMVVPSALQRLREANRVDGQQSVRTALRELEDQGYVRKGVLRYPGGAIAGSAWTLDPTPREGLQRIA